MHDGFEILSLGPGFGRYELFISKLLQANQNPRVKKDNTVIYQDFREEYLSHLTDDAREAEELYFQMEVDDIYEELANAVLEEFTRETHHITGLEINPNHVNLLNELAEIMECQINVEETDFCKKDFGEEKYELVIGGHILALHTNNYLIKKASQLASNLVFLEYSPEVEDKLLPQYKKDFNLQEENEERIIREAFQCMTGKDYQINLKYGKEYSCLIKAKRKN